MDGLEPLVAGVCVRAHRQYVYVPVPYPGHLWTRRTDKWTRAGGRNASDVKAATTLCPAGRADYRSAERS